MINKAEVSEFLSHLELPVDERICGPCGSVDIVRRLIGNVAYGFERNGFIRQAEKMRELLLFVESGATETSSTETSTDVDDHNDDAALAEPLTFKRKRMQKARSNRAFLRYFGRNEQRCGQNVTTDLCGNSGSRISRSLHFHDAGGLFGRIPWPPSNHGEHIQLRACRTAHPRRRRCGDAEGPRLAQDIDACCNNRSLGDEKSHPSGWLFHAVVEPLLGLGGVHKRLDLQDCLSRVCVGVDGDRLGLVVLLAFGVELDFNLTLCAWGDGGFGALRARCTRKNLCTFRARGALSRCW